MPQLLAAFAGLLAFWLLFGAVLGADRVLRFIDQRQHNDKLSLLFWLYVVAGLPLSLRALIRRTLGSKAEGARRWRP